MARRVRSAATEASTCWNFVHLVHWTAGCRCRRSRGAGRIHVGRARRESVTSPQRSSCIARAARRWRRRIQGRGALRMKRYAAFLRGVSPMNAKMPELKKAFEAAGFLDVRTVLSSGSVVFGGPAAQEAALERKGEAAMEEHLDAPSPRSCGRSRRLRDCWPPTPIRASGSSPARNGSSHSCAGSRIPGPDCRSHSTAPASCSSGIVSSSGVRERAPGDAMTSTVALLLWTSFFAAPTTTQAGSETPESRAQAREIAQRLRGARG